MWAAILTNAKTGDWAYVEIKAKSEADCFERLLRLIIRPEDVSITDIKHVG